MPTASSTPVRALKLVPQLIHRMNEYYPPRGAAPPPPPLPEIALIERGHWFGYAALAVLAAATGAALAVILL